MSPRSAKSSQASASGNPPETAKTESKAPKKSVSSPERYTDPELREAIKADVLAGSKGGRPGQWSARKAQLVATEYKRRGGGYLGGPRTAAQKQIQKWDDA